MAGRHGEILGVPPAGRDHKQQITVANYREMTERLARGWNTWHVRSMLTHALLPEGLALQCGLKNYNSGEHIRELVKGPVEMVPGLRSYDGAYTDLTVNAEVKVFLFRRFEKCLFFLPV